MANVDDSYRETYQECSQLLDTAFGLSIATQGREVATRELEVASWVFAKIISHAMATFNMAPKGPLGDPTPDQEFWDVSSMAVLVRAEMDAYYTLFYVALDKVDPEMREFRWLLWDHHSELRRLEKLRLIGSISPELQKLDSQVKSMAEEVTSHSIYKRQHPSVQKKLRKGDLGIFATNTDLSKRAGIDPAYYKSVFMFLSSYVHAHPFSMNQLAAFRAGAEESLHVIGLVLRYAAVYLALAIRDFLVLLPDQKGALSTEVKDLIELWCGVAKDFSERDSANGSA